MGKIFKAIAIILSIAIVTAGCSNDKKEYTETDFLLGTVCTITVYDKSEKSFVKQAFNRIKHLETLMTIKGKAAGSEIKALNDAAGTGKWISLSHETLSVLKAAVRYAEISDGNFDPTIGVLTTKWNIGSEDAGIPSDKEIATGLKLIDYKNIKIDEKKAKAKLLKKGMILDLGGIAKGYAGDVAKRLLVEKGVKHAIINLGGNIVLVGDNANGNDWKVGIQDPLGKSGNYFATISAKDMSVVSSGIYERFYEKDGKRYHHMLDVKTGYPADNGIAATTILSEKSVDGDGLSTSVFLSGREKGLKLLEDEGVEGIIVMNDKKVYITPGIKAIFKIRDATYRVAN